MRLPHSITHLTDFETWLKTWLRKDFIAHPEDYDSLDGPDRALGMLADVLNDLDDDTLRALADPCAELEAAYDLQPKDEEEKERMLGCLYDYLSVQMGEYVEHKLKKKG